MKAFLLLVVVVLAGIGVYKYGASMSDKPLAGSTAQDTPAGQAAQKGEVPAIENISKEEKALNAAATILQQKGAQVIDKRVYGSMGSCQAAVGKITAEYQRRGISATNVVDGSAFLNDRGTMIVLVNQAEYYFLSCLDFETKGWAGYIQFKFTEQQVRALEAAQKQGQ